MKRILVDANVLISGSCSPTGASWAVLTMAEVGMFRMVVTRQILDESERNLRSKFPSALPEFAEILARSKPEVLLDPGSEASRRWHELIHVNDAPIVEAAVSHQVDRIISLNTRHFTLGWPSRSAFLYKPPSSSSRI